MNNSILKSKILPHSSIDLAEFAWNDCLNLVKLQVKALTFKTWFEPLSPISLDQNLLTVEVPSTYFYEWLEEHYFSLIQTCLKSILGPDAKLQYAVKVPKSEDFKRGKVFDVCDEKHDLEWKTSSSSLNNNSIYSSFSNNLNKKFTFDNFIRGDGNQFARAAAFNVANNPGGTAFNPLVIYGGVGLGKTHLIQAIGNLILANDLSKKVYYVSSEKFTVDFVESIEQNKTIDFSSFYRSMDVLIVDDIQFFSGKERTQDTFFHTFNTLYQLKKQIILSSDRPPKELVGLDERLISRFQCGLTVDIQPPDLETRIAILRRKSDEDHVEIPSEVLDFIASNVKSNIRELEGCYIGLIARHTLEKKPITIHLAEKVVRNIISFEKRELSTEQIQKVVADAFNISENSLRAKTRKKEIVIPRQIAMYLSKNLTGSSLKTIGLHFGGRDHSTIIHACKCVELMIKNDVTVKENISDLERKILFLRL